MAKKEATSQPIVYAPHRLTFAQELALIKKTRRIYLQGELDADASYKVIHALAALDTKGAYAIELYINSQGGYIHESMAILDAICGVQNCAVDVIATGWVNSAAAELVALSPKGHRWATPNTGFMFHLSKVGWEVDETSKQKSRADWEDRMENVSIQRLAKAVRKSPKKLRDLMSNEWYLTANEALKNSVIDCIVEYK